MTTTEEPTVTEQQDHTPVLDGERADLLAELAGARFFLTNTTRGLSDEQAGARTTISELCLGGLIKHVAAVERQWMSFVLEGPAAFGGGWELPEGASPSGGELADDEKPAWLVERENEFRLLPHETLAGVVADYEAVAARTAGILAGLPDLSVSHPLPEAPWFEPGASWSARRVLLHIVSETAQHAGHADFLREAIDGAKSMG